ncbi:S8 family peptidase [Clostridium formicaceticum]|uniref:Peptidase S8 n=1 Tax=Clostridium formicaceticum TaxID=1497 RepID=A0AAC9RPK7_9CLOT|nr:S8 family peptidase [Clostridium formicaceticum]AOY75337.1 peptidase S8 [Clostridium formicaceticum]ARE89786.1 Serine protease AprX [Clostridium formicaceticum]
MFSYSNIVEDLVIERLINSNGEHIPVIITGDACECEDLEKCIKELGGVVKHKLPIINAVAAYIPPVGVRSVAREKTINKVHFDDMVFKLMDVASVTVASDYANEHGLTGKGVTVAVVDTGVHPHSDLTTPNNRIIGFVDFVDKKTTPYDDDGHGTHVAGIVAGNGFSSQGKYMGIAPDANIVGVKVLNKDGGGNISDVIAGIQWVIDNKQRYNIKVMTLSLGTKAKVSYREDPLCQAVDKAASHGITVVVAAGNSGPEASTINSPAISPNTIAVGACNDRTAKIPSDCKIADFSSRGPTPDGLKKPDILAPGVNINSLSNKGNGYHSLSGTSMATPIVAGCAALLYENNGNLTPAQVKRMMTESCVNLGYGSEVQGAGLLDIKDIMNRSNISPQPPRKVPQDRQQSSKGIFSIFDGWFFVILIVILILIL